MEAEPKIALAKYYHFCDNIHDCLEIRPKSLCELHIRVFPKIDHSGNVARIVLGLKFVFLFLKI